MPLTSSEQHTTQQHLCQPQLIVNLIELGGIEVGLLFLCQAIDFHCLADSFDAGALKLKVVALAGRA